MSTIIKMVLNVILFPYSDFSKKTFYQKSGSNDNKAKNHRRAYTGINKDLYIELRYQDDRKQFYAFVHQPVLAHIITHKFYHLMPS